MSLQAAKIAQLRASLLPPDDAGRRVALGHPDADKALGGGLACGVLHEVFSAEPGHEAAACGFAFGLALKTAGKKPLFWVRQDFSALETGEIFGAGLLELGADPSSLLLFRAARAEDALRATGEGLSCASLGALVLETYGESKLLDLALSRRLTLAAAHHGVTAIHLRNHAVPSTSAAETRWLVRSQAAPLNEENWGVPRFAANLARNRHGYTGIWVMEWNADERDFRAPADSRGFSAVASRRPAEAAMGETRRYG